MQNGDALQQSFAEFAGLSGSTYADVFQKIQHGHLKRSHINWAAALGSFGWAAARGSWLLFWVGFAVDLLAAVCIALAYKYGAAAAEASGVGKDYLVQRYDSWAGISMWAAVIVFIAGRAVFGWLADRLYYRQYKRWRINRARDSGFRLGRLISAGIIVLLIAPIVLYRASQFAPDARACLKQDRAAEIGEVVSFKDRFDCFVIGEFPTLFRFDRPDIVTYPRAADGSREVKREPPPPGSPPLSLNAYMAQFIDDQIGYLIAFYGWFFDAITELLRAVLACITAVFVGAPWMVTMGIILAVSYKLAGPRVTAFSGATLAYLALFGFWQPAMDTLALVATSALVCVAVGLPLGVWAGKSTRAASVLAPILDVMQTIPSFVYLLPAIAFFSVGKPPGILATVVFAMPPMVRLTALGMLQVPESTKEAAIAFGASPGQLLTKVELPLALPSIMAGVNQVVMMCLSMVVVSALIGAGGMGFIVTEALANAATGRGILAGIGIALLAMTIDRIVQRTSDPKGR